MVNWRLDSGSISRAWVGSDMVVFVEEFEYFLNSRWWADLGIGCPKMGISSRAIADEIDNESCRCNEAVETTILTAITIASGWTKHCIQ